MKTKIIDEILRYILATITGLVVILILGFAGFSDESRLVIAILGFMFVMNENKK